jgi:predicted dienelactone hydrolase
LGAHVGLLLVVLVAGCRADALPPPQVDAGDYTCGFRVLTPAQQGGPADIAVLAVWYPSHAAEADFAYPGHTIGRAAPSSCLASDAPPAGNGAPFPLIVQAHGLYGGAVSMAYCAEYLARHGYVVVATDYQDTLAPDLKRQMAAQRLGPGEVFASGMDFARGAAQWLRYITPRQDELLRYMEHVRLRPTHEILDYVLKQSGAAGSPLAGLIDEQRIGMMGHSLGGLTTLGLIGGDPSPAMRDARIKAAAFLSAPVSLWRTNVERLGIPIMNMHGDNDPASLGAPDDRSALYDLAPPPKYYLILEHANHMSFANPMRVNLADCWQADGPPRVIVSFVSAFFDAQLRPSTEAAARLKNPTSGLVYYAYTLPGAGEKKWGTLPPITRRRLRGMVNP